MTPFPRPLARREFLQTGLAALVAASAVSRLWGKDEPAAPKLFSSMGIAAGVEKAAEMKAAGAEFLTESVDGLLVPDQPEADFEKKLAKLKASPLPVLACNGFIRPSHLHATGPEANHDVIVPRCEIVFRRMKQAGVKYAVFGSAGSRKLPEGFAKDKADEQFVALLKRLGPLAQDQGVTVIIEQLQAKECNYINRIGEAAAIIRAAGHPHIRMLGDLYHMAVMGDTPADLKAAMDVVIHMEIAEKKGRSVPGVSGDDFRPYFKVLKEVGYHGVISIEGSYKNPEQLANAFKEMAKQAAEA